MAQKNLLLTDGKHLDIYNDNNVLVGSLYGGASGTVYLDGTSIFSAGSTKFVVASVEIGGAILLRNTSGVLYVRDDTDSSWVNIQAGAATFNGALTVSSGGASITGDLYVSGDLTIGGSINKETVTELHVTDRWIHLNSGFSGTPSEDSGIIVERGSATDMQLYWDETNDKWVLTDSGGNVRDIVHAGNFSSFFSQRKFTELNDTPASYSGYGGYVVAVKSSEDGLEFQQIAGTDQYVKADSSDPTAGYLSDKVDGTNIDVDTTNHYLYLKSLSGFTTDDLAEGSTHLYFTEEKAQDAVGNILTNSGHSVLFTYDDDTPAIYAEVNVDGNSIINNSGTISASASWVKGLFSASDTATVNMSYSNGVFSADVIVNANGALDTTSGLAVIVDDSTIGINGSNQLYVKSGQFLSNNITVSYVDLSSATSAGTNIDIGSYESGRILVFVNGVFQVPGTDGDYQEQGSPYISFNYDLPSGARITVVKFSQN